MPFLGLPTIFRCWPSSPGRWGAESLGSLFPWSFLFFLGYHWSFGTCRCFAQHCQIPDFSRTQHSCCHSTRLSGSPRGFWRRGYVLHGGHYSNSSHSHSTTLHRLHACAHLIWTRCSWLWERCAETELPWSLAPVSSLLVRPNVAPTKITVITSRRRTWRISYTINCVLCWLILQLSAVLCAGWFCN